MTESIKLAHIELLFKDAEGIAVAAIIWDRQKELVLAGDHNAFYTKGAFSDELLAGLINEEKDYLLKRLGVCPFCRTAYTLKEAGTAIFCGCSKIPWPFPGSNPVPLPHLATARQIRDEQEAYELGG